MRSVDITIPLLSLVFAIGCTLGANGQITITRSDMPQPGDTLRGSMTTTVPPAYQKSARDTTWDFSMLEPLAQRLDTFKAATETPAGYQLVSPWRP